MCWKNSNRFTQTLKVKHPHHHLSHHQFWHLQIWPVSSPSLSKLLLTVTLVYVCVGGQKCVASLNKITIAVCRCYKVWWKFDHNLNLFASALYSINCWLLIFDEVSRVNQKNGKSITSCFTSGKWNFTQIYNLSSFIL